MVEKKAVAAGFHRQKQQSRAAIAATIAVALAALVWSMVATPPLHLVYNLSDSVPIGWYRIQPAHELAVDTVVLASLPLTFRQLAAERDYLPSHLPILKRIGAVSPQHVCIEDGLLYFDSVPTARILNDDRRGRQLPAWRACRHLQDDELFLLSDNNPASFDSRYFGPIRANAVIGRAHPIWLKTDSHDAQSR